MLVTLKLASSFTVASDPSDLVTCTSYVAPSASVSARSIVAPGTAACAAAVALLRSSPVSGVSVIPLATCGPWLASGAVDGSEAAAVDDVELVCAWAVPSTDAPTAPPAMAAPTSALLKSAFCPNFMLLLGG